LALSPAGPLPAAAMLQLVRGLAVPAARVAQT
jgi:hypothetical protein